MACPHCRIEFGPPPTLVYPVGPVIYSLNAWWEKQGGDGKKEQNRKKQTHVPVNHWRKTQDKAAAFLEHTKQLDATRIDLRDMRHV